VAALVGSVNGFLVLRLGMPSFLATLGMMFFLRGATLGLTLMMTGATQIFRLKESLAGDPLLSFFSGTPLGLPVLTRPEVICSLSRGDRAASHVYLPDILSSDGTSWSRLAPVVREWP
jgi:ribose/xylose/arabinose/galactoside ABC-type transport system permease subunit